MQDQFEKIKKKEVILLKALLREWFKMLMRQ